MKTRLLLQFFLLALCTTSSVVESVASDQESGERGGSPKFIGYQNLPSRDGTWAGAYRGVTGPRLGGYTYSYPYLRFTSLNRSVGQAGIGVVFAHELIAIERRDDILLMDGAGVVLSVFDKSQRGEQVWPVASPSRAWLSGRNRDISIQFPNTSRLTLRQVTKNFQGHPLYLLSQVRSVGGQTSTISFTWDQKTQTPRYQKIDSVGVSGRILKGKGSLSFKDEKSPLSAATYVFNDSTVEIKDVAGALIAKLALNKSGHIVSVEDRYGFRSTQAVNGAGLVTQRCDSNKACISYTYNPSELITSSNTSLYPSIVAYNPKTKYPISSKQEGWETAYRYQKTDDPLRAFLLSSVESKSPTGAKVSYTLRYDRFNRLVRKTSSLGEFSEIAYGATPFVQPTRFLQKVKDRIVADVSMTFRDGMLVRSENRLVDPSTPARSVERKFDSLGRLVAVMRPNVATTLKYEDSRHPAYPTEILTNGLEGERYKLNAAGHVVEVMSIPVGERMTISRDNFQAPRLVSATLAGGVGTTTAYSYQAPGYTSGLTRSMNHPEAGLIELESWEGKWDAQYRNLVSYTGFNPNQQADNSGPVRNPEWFYPETSDVVSGTDKPSGIRADASGCSPCAVPHFRDSQGVSLPESRMASQCDGSVVTNLPIPKVTAPPG